MDIREGVAASGDTGDAAHRPHGAVAGTARRRVLAAGLGGAAASLLPILDTLAGAAPRTTPPTEPGTGSSAPTPAPSTTLAPVKRPTQEDVAQLGFAQSVELTLRDLYDIALSGDAFTDEAAKDAVAVMRENHEAYAQAISGLLGREAPNVRDDTLFGEQEGGLGGSIADVATALATLENVAVATHTEVVATLVGVDGSSLIASILQVEARHATVLAKLAGASSFDDLVAGDADPLSADPSE